MLATMNRSDKHAEYETTQQPIYEECVPDPDRTAVWTIPDYEGYNNKIRGKEDALPPIPTKGVDNPAFHDVDIPNVHFTHIPPVKQTMSTTSSSTSTSTTTSTSSSSSTPAKMKRAPLLRMWSLDIRKSVRRDKRATALLCILVTALVLLLATVAVALYLTVGGGLARLNSTSSSTSKSASRRVEGSFKILNRIFTDRLIDRDSEEFVQLRNEIKSLVHATFLASSIADEYNSSEVTSLRSRNGSVEVEMMVHLQDEIFEAPKKVGMAFERGLVREYGQTRLGNFVVDFPSIRFSVVSEDIKPFALNHSGNNMVEQTNNPDSWIARLPPTQTDSTKLQNSPRIPTTPASTITRRQNLSSTWTRLTSSTLTSTQSSTSKTTWSTPTRGPHMSLTHVMRLFPNTPPTPPTLLRATLPPRRHNSYQRLPFPLQSARTAADLLVQWSEWSPWSECDTVRCTRNQTQVRTRECRTKNGTGPRLNDTRLCALLGGVELEVKECPCTTYVPKGLSKDSDSLTVSSTTTSSNVATPRLCNECLSSEVCLALHNETYPICRPMMDPKDPLGCRGWCDANVEYCQRLGNNSFRCVDDRLCLNDEWRCRDGLCVPKEKRCDGHFNCYDMTDEYDCECEPGFFHCGNHTSCVADNKRCDGVVDCWDGEDEANCSKPCDPGFFSCIAEGSCIPAIRFCDDFMDCSDGSDEPKGCMVNWCTPKSEFQCTNRRCLPSNLVCDGFDQCDDGSDEVNCTFIRRPNENDTFKIGCSVDEFACFSGACVKGQAKCDGKIDCADSSDEQNCTLNTTSSSSICPKTHFDCQNGGNCVSMDKRCNDIVDCPDGEDEADCALSVTCLSSEFTCRNGKCISTEDLCDLVNDCGDFSDERECVYEPVKQIDDNFDGQAKSTLNFDFTWPLSTHESWSPNTNAN